jgi:aminoglycoside phosphotransferase (APT) family kinase protein
MTWDWADRELRALEKFLGDLGVCNGPLTSKQIGDGHSNLTFFVSDGERSVVVRRPPPPPTPQGAHDVLREARLMGALRDSGVPVPDVLGVGRGDVVIDVPFVVMSYVAGPVVTTHTPSPLDTPFQRRKIGEALIDSLAALHAVDWKARGLSDFGRPEGFNARHLRRVQRLVATEDGTSPSGFEEIDDWLVAHVPPEAGASIVHNDYRLGNVILAPDEPGRIAAVLDWELATIGDPLLDVSYFLASCPVEGEDLTPTNEFATALLEPGYPSRLELAQRYSDFTGLDLGDLHWYTAMAQWKLAVLYEYGRRRAVAGKGDQYYADGGQVRSFLNAAHRAAGLRPSAVFDQQSIDERRSPSASSDN